MKNERMFQLLYLLLEKSAASAPQLARQLGVSVRTIYRDVDALSACGVPVYATSGRGGGIALMPGYTFDRTLLSGQEQNQLLFALQSLRLADEQADGLIRKLGAMFHQPNAEWIEVDFSRWGYSRVDHRRFDTLRNAILEKRVLCIRYCGTSGKTAWRDVKPFRLVFKDRAWYLRAWCLKADDYRLFKVSRILECETLTETFTDLFDEAPPLEFDDYDVSELQKCRLHFTAEAAYRVYDEFNPKQIAKQPDGTLEVETMFPSQSWVMEYLLSYGAMVTVREPASFQKSMLDMAEKIARNYKT